MRRKCESFCNPKVGKGFLNMKPQKEIMKEILWMIATKGNLFGTNLIHRVKDLYDESYRNNSNKAVIYTKG